MECTIRITIVCQSEATVQREAGRLDLRGTAQAGLG